MISPSRLRNPRRKPRAKWTVKLAAGRELRYGAPVAHRRIMPLIACLILTACQDRGAHHRPIFDAAPTVRRDANRPPTCRASVVLKVDDLGGPLGANAARFIERVAAAGGVAALGLITSRLPMEPPVVETYRDLDRRGFELWFHGHRHDWSLPEAEFAGVGVEAQREALRLGLATARERLGIELKTFGAPGNAIDDDTLIAVRDFPQIDAWFFGRAGTQALVLPRLLELEAEVGVVRDPESFLADLDRLLARAPPVVTLQIHPNGFHGGDPARFDAILEGLAERGVCLVTPREVVRAARGSHRGGAQAAEGAKTDSPSSASSAPAAPRR